MVFCSGFVVGYYLSEKQTNKILEKNVAGLNKRIDYKYPEF